MSREPIRVAIADDQVLLREMLSMVISSSGDMEVTGLAGSGDEILEVCRRRKTDIVLMDIKMPGKGGFCAMESLKREMPQVRVLMLTTFGDERNVLEAFRKGADGYILKDIKPDLLLLAIRCACGGMFVMQEEVASLVRKRLGQQVSDGAGLFPGLERERDEYGLDAVDRNIIRLLVEGKSNREIGEILCYSEGSVKNRITRILETTGLKDRTQIAVFALQNNIV